MFFCKKLRRSKKNQPQHLITMKMKAAQLNETLPARFRTTSATGQTTTDYIAMKMCAFLYKQTTNHFH